jgi:hypothetical protein
MSKIYFVYLGGAFKFRDNSKTASVFELSLKENTKEKKSRSDSRFEDLKTKKPGGNTRLLL